ncbi:MFS transporter [Corynebacterium ammoniagenes]|uniref:Transporter, major facilitator family protein n=1 Tax=Corynebacterium ammoniagenes DSM 20306 TaxID=649754 RepID=A0ABN0ADL9_CORAM|nr:MFS transporter [Corynebacterium ammoniagenes]AQS73865.1 MFS transporter [Corynebacterium ammoniagenes]EFG80762.1 transporter, major facilitator family protein [Corynebacterium ammoniagenes DSM 20306]
MTHEHQAVPSKPPVDDSHVEKYRRRAIAASGIGWGLDGFTWTMYGFALTAAMPVLGMSEGASGWVTAISIVASAAGGVIFGNLADRFGRINMLTVVILGYSIFTALTATSQHTFDFLLWRTLEGLFFGGEWAVGAALVAEYARPEKRGRSLAIVQSCYAIGWAVSTTAYLTLYSIFPPEVAWRYLFLVGIIPALAAFVIRRTTKDATEISGQSKPDEGKSEGKFARLFKADLRARTLSATLLGVGVQGIYYSVFIFLPTYLQEDRGLSIVGTATYTWVAIVGSFIGYVASGFLLDAIGRRPTFLFFFLGSAASVSLFVLTPAAQPELGILIILLLGFFASGQAGGTGAYLAELFPTEVRATGQAISYNFGRGLAAFGPLTVGIAAASIGWGYSIMIIAIAGAILGIIALSLLPETKNSQLVSAID